MGQAVSHGSDADRLDTIAASVGRLSDRTSDLVTTGAHLIAVLGDAWAGADQLDLARSWTMVARQVQDTAQMLRTMSDELRRQAEGQRSGSDSTGGATGSPGRTGDGAPGRGVPGDGEPPTGAATHLMGRGDDDSDTSSPQPVDDYHEGPPQRPQIEWDEDFEFDSDDPTAEDWRARGEWEAKRRGARLLRPDLDDGLDMYDHYWDGNGEPATFDYEEAAREDPSVAQNINDETARTIAAVDEMAQGRGDGTFQISGPATQTDHYPTTENWQKAVGGYQQWSSADVTVEDGMVTMEITVHAEDHYNFNKGQSDIETSTPDDVNGRFMEVGWAQSFDSSGSVTRTVTWPVGSPPPDIDVASRAPERG